MATTLLYIPSDEIIRFVSDNPIDWSDPDLAKRKGPGDRAGATPTPAVEEFLNLLLIERQLFTQKRYADWCFGRWCDWLIEKQDEQVMGVKAKLYRNFYPSMIDSLHVWAMLVESGRFDSCALDSADDAIGKTDLTITSGDGVFRLALLGPTDNAMQDRQYKIKHRSAGETACIEIALPIAYPRKPGNKRWFKAPEVLNAIMQGGYLPPPRRQVPAPGGNGQLSLFCGTQGGYNYGSTN